jgi:hypothetical protein
MYWTEAEEHFQQIAEQAGAIPPQALLPEEEIAEDAGILWHIPEGLPEAEMDGGPPPMNGVHQDYEGELVEAIHAAWAAFGQDPKDELPG